MVKAGSWVGHGHCAAAGPASGFVRGSHAMKRTLSLLSVLLLTPWSVTKAAENHPSTQAHVPVEITFTAVQLHPEPFVQVSLDVVFTDPAGAEKTVPGFWAGGREWKVRYTSSVIGSHRYRARCSETGDTGLHGVEGRVEVTPYTGDRPLYRHGLLRIAGDQRHFEHHDGTPFLWLGTRGGKACASG